MRLQPGSMNVYAIVEVVEPEEIHGARLIRAAYRASARGPVLLLLRDVQPAAVDAILDPLVPALGAGVAGVRYLTPGDPSVVWRDAVRSAKWIVALTSEWREQVRRLGRESVDPAAALRLLEDGIEPSTRESA